MEEPERGGRRPSAKDGRKATESNARTTTAQAPRPKPVPVASSQPKMAPGVPMAGQSYAKRQAEKARGASQPPPPPPAARPKPTPPVATAQDLDLEEDFDLEAEYEEDLDEAPAPALADTPSRIYSTRRALAEQVNKDVAERPYKTESTGMEAIREKREAWKKTVKAKEEEGKSPYIMRWAKVSFFPLLYFGMSMLLLRRISYEYAEYYDYDPIFIVLGFITGAIFLVIATTMTMLRAKRLKRPIQLKGKTTWIGLLVFIGISFFLAFQYGLAYAWLFSIGFLAAGLLIVGIGLLLEKSGNGTYWVKDPLDASDKRWLEFTPVGEV